MGVLLTSAVSVAFFHALAPDHWLPFVALAKVSHWPMKRLAWITTLAGLGHVVSSLLLGLVGLWVGLAVHHLEGAEAWRGHVGIWLLIGFGVAYALWGFKHAQHPHPHISVEDAVKAYAVRRMWMLFAIMVFGPCEPLIPLMFVASRHGLPMVWAISAAFSVVTVAMVVGQSCLSYAGVRLVDAPWMSRYAHMLTGVVIVLTALAVMLLGV
ncbi:MAG: hypothetical protein A3I71_03725 [Omnitrophica WOR_2 bacterium RIFCSPLOWO2_02_FULL_63_16]|nr:MAG: hypothetical protein A2Z92_01310 [Omnitrophica WOR_2 bacterium GWA2_63_20]OGX46078.1 MAG: hypothetical protein A3I71_03725 [Omnitrophica WOR_2 bacterium RIFCSPLOWO2_02_FULL_63_16]OGX48912.1 MAG: hypothetical protein A3G88_07315 [Omnitrophica WOR_2 bacterium RIFCSPLOWO2_12_FULL_63_16]HBQ37473.1 hypothetical protein [Candidatus Omnitrophota bacterium]